MVRLGRVLLAGGAIALACDLRIAEAPVAAQPSVSDRTPAPAESGRRRAVLVGIDDYSASRLGKPRARVANRGWLNLYGAVNDVESMREMLVLLYGFQASDVLVLTNQAATRAAILQAIALHLEQPARKGDVILFYYAGHGSQVPNSRSSELDRLDESLVPADSRTGARDIRDKELRRAFNRILDRGARLTVILDSCHSGSGARGLMTDGRSRAVRRDPRDVADGTIEGPRPEARGALVISAAQDREIARETVDDRGKSRGVFSWAWLRAMRRATPGERATDTFLRAQALIRAESPSQDPVLAGSAEARSTPFLSTRLGSGAGSLLAVEQVRPDGTVIVQGGWAHGLTVGSELRLARSAGDARLEVKEMLGLGRCEARLVSPAAVPAALTAGALLEIAGWASPPGRPLRVWMPQVSSTAAMVEWAEALARAASRKNIRWIDDPVDKTPAHLLRWRDGAWDLLAGDGEGLRFAAGAGHDVVLANIRRGASLFVQLPAPAWLVKGIAVGAGTDYAAVEPAKNPETADYVLTGRMAKGDVEYAWVRPLVTKADQGRTALPACTAWHSASRGANIGPLLQNAVLRLRRIHAWQLLESPPEARSGYELVLRRRADNTPVLDRILVGNEDYALVLHARPAAKPTPRYMYAFVIDSHGRSVLLYPTAETGSVENRFPLDARAPAPAEIALDTVFHPTEPYGVDTYFLLTTDEALLDPSILEWDGVRGRPAARTALEALLTETSIASRSAALVQTPANWSIDRMLFESVPAKPKGPS